MKTIIAAAIISLAALSAGAGVTNITVKTTVEIAGVGTNTASLKIQQDGSKRDALMADGLVKGYNDYIRAGLGTNDMSSWLKDAVKAKVDEYAAAKSQADNAALAGRIASILTAQPDLLSTSQKNQLDSIGTLVP